MTKVEFQITRDVYEGDLEEPVKIQVESSPDGIHIICPTLSDYEQERILIEVAHGEVRAIVWDNPKIDEPQIIPIMEGIKKKPLKEYKVEFAWTERHRNSVIVEAESEAEAREKFYDEVYWEDEEIFGSKNRSDTLEYIEHLGHSEIKEVAKIEDNDNS